MLDGNMVCGIAGEGLMYRVGKAAYGEALTLPAVHELSFTGRPMGGMVELAPKDAEDTVRTRLLAMSLAHARGLPPKRPKS